MAINATGRADRVINTQDVRRAAIVPAALFLLLGFAIGWISADRSGAATSPSTGEGPPTWGEVALSILAVVFLALLLGGVAGGYIFAVEGAATGAVMLLAAGMLTRRIEHHHLGSMLAETMATAGILFAPLLAATTFTLAL